jgi:hypothetical protein
MLTDGSNPNRYSTRSGAVAPRITRSALSSVLKEREPTDSQVVANIAESVAF